MAIQIDALITSVDDPQLPRCLEAVKNQTVPFSKIVHLHNVCPHHEAVNRGLPQTSADWVMYIGGDMILDLNANERIMEYMRTTMGDNVCGYYFGLWDTFLDCKIGYLGVFKGPLYRGLKFPDIYNCDAVVVRALRNRGWRTIKNVNFIVGTHFDQPDEYQVFKRCLRHGSRYVATPHKSLKWNFIKLLKKRYDPLYEFGIKVVEYGEKQPLYVGARNLIEERRDYEKYKALHSHCSPEQPQGSCEADQKLQANESAR